MNVLRAVAKATALWLVAVVVTLVIVAVIVGVIAAVTGSKSLAGDTGAEIHNALRSWWVEAIAVVVIGIAVTASAIRTRRPRP